MLESITITAARSNPLLCAPFAFIIITRAHTHTQIHVYDFLYVGMCAHSQSDHYRASSARRLLVRIVLCFLFALSHQKNGSVTKLAKHIGKIEFGSRTAPAFSAQQFQPKWCKQNEGKQKQSSGPTEH